MENLIKIYAEGFVLERSKKWIEGYKAYKKLGWFLPNGLEKLIKKIDFKPYKPHGITHMPNYIPIFEERQAIAIRGTGEIFFVCPLWPEILLSVDGRVAKVKNIEDIEISDSFIRNPTSTYQYKSVSFNMSGISNKTNQGLHKLLALTFIPNDDYVNKNLIDHIDGNKLNNDLSNLRWISVTENNYKSKSNTSNLTEFGFIARNIDTGKIIKCLGIKTLCNLIRRSVIPLNTVKLEQGKIWTSLTGRWEIYEVINFKKWEYENNIPEFTNEKIETINEFYVKNILTKEITKCNSQTEGAALIGITKQSISFKLINKQFDIIGKYLISLNKEGPWQDDEPNFDPRPVNKKFIMKINTKGEKLIPLPVAQHIICKELEKDEKTVKNYIRNCKIITKNNEEFIIRLATIEEYMDYLKSL